MNTKRLLASFFFGSAFLVGPGLGRVHLIGASPVAAQDATPTPTNVFTRRPTPTPTVTHTPTPTPTPQSDFLCSGGARDGLTCENDVDCENGACVFVQGVCNGGTNDGNSCTTDTDCGGTACTPSAKVCTGDFKGFACLSDAQCSGGSCVSNGLFCYGGDYFRLACVDDADCQPPGGNPGVCRAPATPVPDSTLCSGGSSDGASCDVDSDCSGGACLIAQNVCDGGEFSDGEPCFADTDCDPGYHCLPTQMVCSGGDFKGFACLRTDQCNGAACLSNGLFCYGGVFDRFACVDSADCELPDQPAGTCQGPATPLPDTFLCSGGTNDGQACFGPSDCPNGACVFAQNVCNGGDTDGDVCSASTDCSAGTTCTPSAKVCNAGDYRGVGCLNDGHCPGGSCVSTGLFCSGGDFDGFACVVDADCSAPGGVAGKCVAPVPVSSLCSAGANDGQSCQTDADCPDGSCVITQGVCDGGSADSDSCGSDADCPGGTCQPSYQVCSSGDYPGFPCLRDNQCTGDPSPTCISSGRVCDGGPFDTFSCIDDRTCNCQEGDDTCLELEELAGACVGRTPRSCTIDQPCSLDQIAAEQVFGPPNYADDEPLVPASTDYYLSAVPSGAKGLELVLRMSGGDADLYAGKTPSDLIADYDFSSASQGVIDEEIRIDSFSTPTFQSLTSTLSNIAVTVVGFDQSPTYQLDALYLGDSPPGDTDCNQVVDEQDVAGITRVLFDPSARFNCPGFGRGIGTDANIDGRNDSADLVAALKAIGGGN